MKSAIGIYFVIGYGRDCDGSESFKCTAFIDKHFAEAYCDSCRHGSDGIQYDMTSDMTHVYEYCHAWNKPIPLAYVEIDQIICNQCTYVDYISND